MGWFNHQLEKDQIVSQPRRDATSLAVCVDIYDRRRGKPKLFQGEAQSTNLYWCVRTKAGWVDEIHLRSLT